MQQQPPSGIDLSKMPNHKVIVLEDAKEFELSLNQYVRSGWKVVSVSNTVTWSEKREAFQYSFLGIFAKAGIK